MKTAIAAAVAVDVAVDQVADAARSKKQKIPVLNLSESGFLFVFEYLLFKKVSLVVVKTSF